MILTFMSFVPFGIAIYQSSFYSLAPLRDTFKMIAFKKLVGFFLSKFFVWQERTIAKAQHICYW